MNTEERKAYVREHPSAFRIWRRTIVLCGIAFAVYPIVSLAIMAFGLFAGEFFGIIFLMFAPFLWISWFLIGGVYGAIQRVEEKALSKLVMAIAITTATPILLIYFAYMSNLSLRHASSVQSQIWEFVSSPYILAIVGLLILLMVIHKMYQKTLQLFSTQRSR